METERHLLFGALCVKFGLISFDQLAANVTDWQSGKQGKSLSLAEVIASNGLIRGEQRTHIERAMAERLEEFGGDVRKTLNDVLDEGSLIKLAEIARDEFSETEETALEQVTPSDSTSSRSRSGTWNVGSTQAHFHLNEETGQGGMGQVWLARVPTYDTRCPPADSPISAIRPTSTLYSFVCAFTQRMAVSTSSAHVGQRCCGASR